MQLLLYGVPTTVRASLAGRINHSKATTTVPEWVIVVLCCRQGWRAQ